MEGQEEEEKTNMEKKVEKEEWIGSLKLQAIQIKKSKSKVRTTKNIYLYFLHSKSFNPVRQKVFFADFLQNILHLFLFFRKNTYFGFGQGVCPPPPPRCFFMTPSLIHIMFTFRTQNSTTNRKKCSVICCSSPGNQSYHSFPSDPVLTNKINIE